MIPILTLTIHVQSDAPLDLGEPRSRSWTRLRKVINKLRQHLEEQTAFC